MKLSFRNNVVGLSAETPEEEAICAQLRAADGHVFKLHAASQRGLAFSLIGPEDDARRAPLNILHKIEPAFAPISNLAHTPFTFDDGEYASIEGFWQGLKVADPDGRRAMARLFGGEAKGRGGALGWSPTFDYGGVTIVTGSPEHWALMGEACFAKFTQNDKARKALLATGERWLTHKVRKDSRTIPGAVMADIWMDIRSRLKERGATA
ncbi:hypothetical protein [Dongia sp.]|uniref:hypothetical protein n=1 Tax=Dongia sp. TaxID=1977262 RepID=UPI0035AE546A